MIMFVMAFVMARTLPSLARPTVVLFRRHFYCGTLLAPIIFLQLAFFSPLTLALLARGAGRWQGNWGQGNFRNRHGASRSGWVLEWKLKGPPFPCPNSLAQPGQICDARWVGSGPIAKPEAQLPNSPPRAPSREPAPSPSREPAPSPSREPAPSPSRGFLRSPSPSGLKAAIPGAVTKSAPWKAWPPNTISLFQSCWYKAWP
jgi:hypothetical protein